jgi:hypothetical protein
MAVDEEAIRTGGRRRVRRQRAVRSVATLAAVGAIGGLGWAALPERPTAAPAASAPHSAAPSSLDIKVAEIAASPTAVEVPLADGTRVWIDPGDLTKRGHMRMAARSATGVALGAGAKSTAPVGEPYNVTLDWTRTLVKDRLLVWGVDLPGTSQFKPDLAPGMNVVGTKTAKAAGGKVMVYVIDVRTADGRRPSTVEAVTGLGMRTP